MKKTNKIFQIGLFALSLLFSAKSASAQAISTHFFGENAWMPAVIGSTVLNGKLDKHWGDIKNSNASMIRYGGIAGDKDMPTNEQYLNIIDSIRANGMEPVIQVPFDKYKYTAQQAAGIVNYINVVSGRHVKYWSIGNEPDLGYSFTSAAQVAGYIKPFASAMKNADPSIKIIGPDCAWFNTGVMNGLLTPNGPDDITGKDGAGRYYLDIISFHTYPFNGTQTRDQVISKLTAPGSFQDNLILLNTRVAACNTAHGRTAAAALKTAVTEANVAYQNAANDNLQGVGANSFIGGQFIAEMLGIGMKNGVDFINIWSVVEGNSTASNIGYLDRTTGNKKPAYYHFRLLAENFRGDVANCTTNQTNVKSFGCKDALQISILILNEELTGTYDFTIRLNTSAISGINPLKINVNAGLDVEYTGAIGSQSSVLFTFNSQGRIIKKQEYSLETNAMANLAPTITEFPILLPVELVSFTGSSDGGQNRLEWETASETNNDYFTVEKQDEDKSFVSIGNIDGAGSSSTYNQYRAYDSNPENGISYYRLKQTDYNGAYTYSSVIPVENRLSAVSISNVYPNPTSDDVSFNFYSGTNGNVGVQLLDFTGRIIVDEVRSIADGGSILHVKMSALPDGVYTLRVENHQTGHVSATKVVKK